MITISSGKPGDNTPFEFRGLSTDKKPTDSFYPYVSSIPNGSVLYCMDTGQVLMYNAASKSWIEQ